VKRQIDDMVVILMMSVCEGEVQDKTQRPLQNYVLRCFMECLLNATENCM
jgi:hypothetical protein